MEHIKSEFCLWKKIIPSVLGNASQWMQGLQLDGVWQFVWLFLLCLLDGNVELFFIQCIECVGDEMINLC